MLTRFDPVVDLERITSELLGPLSRRSAVMPLDAYRHEDNWIVKVDLPGVDPSTIDVTVDRNILRIEATRDWQPSEGDKVLALERPRGSFTRQLMLGEDVDSGAINAEYRDGVLTVVLPVSEQAKPRKVAISTGSPSNVVEVTSSEHQAA
ncbi:MAG: Hsp20/alpha crystallin family protein [Acidimicrobiales bacterium]